MKDKLLQLGIKAYKLVARYRMLMPRLVNVETTKVCNLRCPGCRRNYSESITTEPGPKHLTVDALRRIVATVPVRVVKFEGDGEPTANPHFENLVAFCHKVGIRSAMTSNGTLLDRRLVKFLEEHGMVRIHISFDGAERDTFEKTRRGADYERVLRSCRLLGESKIQLFMSVLLSSEEIIEQLPKYIKLAKNVGAAGIHLMKFQQENLEFGNPPDLSRHRGALRKFKEDVKDAGLIYVGTVTDRPTFVECADAYTCPYVLLNNDVYPCSYMANLRKSEAYLGEVFPVPSRNYRMGSLNDCSMRDVWIGDAYRELRRVLKETRKPTGYTTTPEALLEVKKDMVGKERFSYCVGCLCRWGESGL